MRHLTLASFAAAAVLGLVIAGCGTTESTTSTKPDSTDSQADHNHGDHDHGDHDDGDHDDGDHDDGDHDDGDHDDGDRDAGEHDHAAHDHGDHDAQGTAGKTDMEKMKAELAKMTPEDAASAEKQHFCPVTGDMLGVDGPPLKVTVKGRVVWVCCDDCQEKVKADPDKYLAKLDSH